MIEPGKGPVFFDTETVGYYGPTVLIQWKQGDGPITLHEVWRSPIIDTLTLIEGMMNNPDGIIGFNLTFDMFHLCQTFTTLLLLADKVGFDQYAEDWINEYAVLEADARDGPCLKPVTATDLMLIARKGPYQSTMDRSDIRIRRVPTALAWQLADELEHRIPLKDIYFARRKDKHRAKWQVFDIEDEDGDIIPDFKDVVLSFQPSSALKALAADALGVRDDVILKFTDIELDKQFLPKELGYAPFATAIGKPGRWKGAWPDVIEKHISHWAFSELARKYAAKDVEYLPQLYNFFRKPELGDDDSILACMVAAVRWHGFKIDVDGIKELRSKALVSAAKAPTAPANARKYIEAMLDATERAVLRGSTNKVTLEKMVKDSVWTQVPCMACNESGLVDFGGDFAITAESASAPSDDNDFNSMVDFAIMQDGETESTMAVLEAPTKGTCEVCDGKKVFRHPASFRAEEVLNARMATKELELYDKLLTAGRFHASFVVIGTLSSRMAGSDKLNPQGIKKTKEVRSKFPLAYPGYILCGGDFKSFEVVLADAVYGDPDLRRELQSKVICPDCNGSGVKRGNPCKDCEGTGKAGRSIHAIFGTYVYPGMSYEDVMRTKGTKDDKYTRSKSAVFAMLYGGEAYTLMTRLGVPIEVADAAYQQFTRTYKKVGEERHKVFDMFCVSGDTWTLTSEGPRRVRELIGKPSILIVDGQAYKTDGFFANGHKSVLELETTEGYKLRATADHQILTNYLPNYSRNDCGISLWQELGKLQPGDKIHLNRHMDREWDGEGTFEEGYILGWLFGDGSIATGQPDNRLYFYPDDMVMIPFMVRCFHNHPEIKPIDNKCYYMTSPEIAAIMEKFGVGPEKAITPFIEMASSDFLKGFCSAFFDTDGGAREDVKQVELYQSDRPRLEAMQRILLRFGIKTSINLANEAKTYIIEGRSCKGKAAYKLYLGASNVVTFHERIGFQNPGKREKVVAAIAQCDSRKLYKEYFLAEVKSITYIGEENVYDVTVPIAQSFDGNGFKVHNCSMRQPGGIGSKVEWHEPADYIESVFGFRRYFTLENQICKTLFELAQNPPKDWRDIKIKVVRRDRQQTASGAVQSALYGAAFQIQAANMRAAANHVIQSAGAQVTKKLQRNIWELQPPGVHEFIVYGMNIHDEIMCPIKEEYIPQLEEIVRSTVESFRPRVPLIAIDWGNNLNSWADK